MYIIDGNNLIGAVKRDDVGSEESRFWLFKILKEFQKLKRSKIVLFFDGPRTPELIFDYGDIEVVFSEELEADQLIKDRINKIHYRKNMVLVSRDRDLKIFARQKKVKVQSPEKFFKFVLSYIRDTYCEKPEPENLTDTELKLWEDLMKKGKK